MANTQVGRILSIGQTVNVSKKEKAFLKRELILDASRYDEYTGEKHENYITFSFTQKRCEELNGYQVGELVEVSFIINGRPYEKNGQTKYINDVVGYKIERKGNNGQQGSVQPTAPQAPQPQYGQQYQQPSPLPQYQQQGQFPPQVNTQGQPIDNNLPF